MKVKRRFRIIRKKSKIKLELRFTVKNRTGPELGNFNGTSVAFPS